MIRLRRDDFEDPHELAKLAATAGISLEDFRRQFEYLIGFEPPPLLSTPMGRPAMTTSEARPISMSFLAPVPQLRYLKPGHAGDSEQDVDR